jgi:hypothetical protein
VTKRILGALAALAAAFTLMLGLSTSAWAGSDGPTVCNSDPQTACSWFHQDGDIVYVKDMNCDGHAAVAVVEVPAAGIYENLWNTDGCGVTDHKQYGTAIPEGSRVYYKACFGIYSTRSISNCSGIGSGVA